MKLSKNLSFGFTGTYSVAQTMQLVQQAEEAGLESVWLAEDYFQSGVFSLAAACAVKTQRIQIGIGVINPFTRHPALSAMEAATLDEISGGRIMLALGASNKKWIETQAGIPYVKPITATKESAVIIKHLTLGEEVDFQGEYFKTGKIKLHNPPFRSSLPIYMGVKGDVALTAAGEVADGVLLSSGSPLKYVRYAKERITQGAKQAGRDPASVKIAAYLPTVMHEDEATAIELARPLAARYMGLHGEHPIMTCAGLTKEDVAPFREAFLNGVKPSAAVTDRMVHAVVVAGTPNQCAAKIQEYINAGVDMPIVFEAIGIYPASKSIQLLKEHLL